MMTSKRRAAINISWVFISLCYWSNFSHCTILGTCPFASSVQDTSCQPPPTGGKGKLILKWNKNILTWTETPYILFHSPLCCAAWHPKEKRNCGDVKSLVTRREDKITVLPSFKGWVGTWEAKSTNSASIGGRYKTQVTGHRPLFYQYWNNPAKQWPVTCDLYLPIKRPTLNLPCSAGQFVRCRLHQAGG